MKFLKTGILLVTATFAWGPLGGHADSHHVLDTSKDGMKKIAGALGVKCKHCHAAVTSEGKPDFEAPSPLKDTARQMKLHFVDSLRTADGKALECDTCHDGHAKFVPREAESAGESLTKTMARRELMTTMRRFTKALNVKCLFCHTKAEDGRMDPTIPTKHRRMARYMWDNYSDLKLLDGQQVVCMTCHQGKTEFLPTHGE